jgi:hypothetical protein
MSWVLCFSVTLRLVTGKQASFVSVQHGNPEMSDTDHPLTRKNIPQERRSQSIRTEIRHFLFHFFYGGECSVQIRTEIKQKKKNLQNTNNTKRSRKPERKYILQNNAREYACAEKKTIIYSLLWLPVQTTFTGSQNKCYCHQVRKRLLQAIIYRCVLHIMEIRLVY